MVTWRRHTLHDHIRATISTVTPSDVHIARDAWRRAPAARAARGSERERVRASIADASKTIALSCI
eukprot:scaffold2499_cov129-Isochrysis_galbana.AAC.13